MSERAEVEEQSEAALGFADTVDDATPSVQVSAIEEAAWPLPFSALRSAVLVAHSRISADCHCCNPFDACYDSQLVSGPLPFSA
jgi:hypothetical protein